MPSFYPVLTVLTTIPKMTKKKKTKMKRMSITKERPNPMMGHALGHLFVRIQKSLPMWVVIVTYT